MSSIFLYSLFRMFSILRPPSAFVGGRSHWSLSFYISMMINVPCGGTMYLPFGGSSWALRRTNSFLCLLASASRLKNRARVIIIPATSEFGCSGQAGPSSACSFTQPHPAPEGERARERKGLIEDYRLTEHLHAVSDRGRQPMAMDRAGYWERTTLGGADC